LLSCFLSSGIISVCFSLLSPSIYFSSPHVDCSERLSGAAVDPKKAQKKRSTKAGGGGGEDSCEAPTGSDEEGEEDEDEDGFFSDGSGGESSGEDEEEGSGEVYRGPVDPEFEKAFEEYDDDNLGGLSDVSLLLAFLLSFLSRLLCPRSHSFYLLMTLMSFFLLIFLLSFYFPKGGRGYSRND
jgi:hypothetical protein